MRPVSIASPDGGVCPPLSCQRRGLRYVGIVMFCWRVGAAPRTRKALHTVAHRPDEGKNESVPTRITPRVRPRHRTQNTTDLDVAEVIKPSVEKPHQSRKRFGGGESATYYRTHTRPFVRSITSQPVCAASHRSPSCSLCRGRRSSAEA